MKWRQLFRYRRGADTNQNEKYSYQYFEFGHLFFHTDTLFATVVMIQLQCYANFHSGRNRNHTVPDARIYGTSRSVVDLSNLGARRSGSSLDDDHAELCELRNLVLAAGFKLAETLVQERWFLGASRRLHFFFSRRSLGRSSSSNSCGPASFAGPARFLAFGIRPQKLGIISSAAEQLAGLS